MILDNIRALIQPSLKIYGGGGRRGVVKGAHVFPLDDKCSIRGGTRDRIRDCRSCDIGIQIVPPWSKCFRGVLCRPEPAVCACTNGSDLIGGRESANRAAR